MFEEELKHITTMSIKTALEYCYAHRYFSSEFSHVIEEMMIAGAKAGHVETFITYYRNVFGNCEMPTLKTWLLENLSEEDLASLRPPDLPYSSITWAYISNKNIYDKAKYLLAFNYRYYMGPLEDGQKELERKLDV